MVIEKTKKIIYDMKYKNKLQKAKRKQNESNGGASVWVDRGMQ